MPKARKGKANPLRELLDDVGDLPQAGPSNWYEHDPGPGPEPVQTQSSPPTTNATTGSGPSHPDPDDGFVTVTGRHVKGEESRGRPSTRSATRANTTIQPLGPNTADNTYIPRIEDITIVPGGPGTILTAASPTNKSDTVAAIDVTASRSSSAGPLGPFDTDSSVSGQNNTPPRREGERGLPKSSELDLLKNSMANLRAQWELTQDSLIEQGKFIAKLGDARKEDKEGFIEQMRSLDNRVSRQLDEVEVRISDQMSEIRRDFRAVLDEQHAHNATLARETALRNIEQSRSMNDQKTAIAELRSLILGLKADKPAEKSDQGSLSISEDTISQSSSYPYPKSMSGKNVNLDEKPSQVNSPTKKANSSERSPTAVIKTEDDEIILIHPQTTGFLAGPQPDETIEEYEKRINADIRRAWDPPDERSHSPDSRHRRRILREIRTYVTSGKASSGGKFPGDDDDDDDDDGDDEKPKPPTRDPSKGPPHPNRKGSVKFSEPEKKKSLVSSVIRYFSEEPIGGPQTAEAFMDAYTRKILNRIKVMILEEPEVDFKGSSSKAGNAPTDEYKGDNDFGMFDSWLTSVLSWLSSKGFCGLKWKRMHIDTLIRSLADEPKRLATNHLTAVIDDTGDYPEFTDVVLLILGTYVKASSLLNTIKKFQAVTYDTSRGISSFFTDLVTASREMAMPPTQAQFTERFLNGIPIRIKERLIMDEGVRMETTPHNKLLEAAVRVEEMFDQLKAADLYKKLNTANSSSAKSTSSIIYKPRTNNTNRPPVARRATVDKSGKNYNPRFKPSENTNNKYSQNTTQNARLANNHIKGETPEQRSSSVFKNAKESNFVGKDGKPLCWNCGKPGVRWECPNHENPKLIQRLYANYVLEHPDQSWPIYGEESELPDESETEDKGTNPDSEDSDLSDDVYLDDPHDERYNSNSESGHDHIAARYMNSVRVARIAESTQANTRKGLRPLILGGMSTIGKSDALYALKLASTRKQEALTAEERIADELVDEPIRRFKTEGQIPQGRAPSSKQAGNRNTPNKITKKNPPMFDAKFRLSRKAGTYPGDQDPELKATLTAMVNIHGTKAYVLFDSGAETDALSPDFVRACHIPLLELPDPIVLQMGTKGSRSCIYYGTNVDIDISNRKDKHYFNIVNIDRYDAILGAPWLNAYKAKLDFGLRVVHVHGLKLGTLSRAEDDEKVATGYAARKANPKQKNHSANGPDRE